MNICFGFTAFRRTALIKDKMEIVACLKNKELKVRLVQR